MTLMMVSNDIVAEDRDLARRIADVMTQRGLPRPRSSQYLTTPVRRATQALLCAIQALYDVWEGASARALRAETLIQALDADQAGWEAVEDSLERLAAAIAELRALKVDVLVDVGGRGLRERSGIRIVLSW